MSQRWRLTHTVNKGHGSSRSGMSYYLGRANRVEGPAGTKALVVARVLARARVQADFIFTFLFSHRKPSGLLTDRDTGVVTS